jgi:hypothetical protein
MGNRVYKKSMVSLYVMSIDDYLNTRLLVEHQPIIANLESGQFQRKYFQYKFSPKPSSVSKKDCYLASKLRIA